MVLLFTLNLTNYVSLFRVCKKTAKNLRQPVEEETALLKIHVHKRSCLCSCYITFCAASAVFYRSGLKSVLHSLSGHPKKQGNLDRVVKIHRSESHRMYYYTCAWAFLQKQNKVTMVMQHEAELAVQSQNMPHGRPEGTV